VALIGKCLKTLISLALGVVPTVLRETRLGIRSP